MFVQLVDETLQRRGGYDRFPRENYNTYLWVPGEVVDDGFAVPVEAEAPAGVYGVRLGWYLKGEEQVTALPLIQDGQEVTESSVVIGPIKVNGPPAGVVVETAQPEYRLTATPLVGSTTAATPTPLVPGEEAASAAPAGEGAMVELGGIIGLLGYDLSHQSESLTLTLYWQSLAQTETNYTVFVHLRDEAGKTIAQADGPPVQGRYPTSLWDAGEIIPDRFTVTIPSTLRGYMLAVGLYDPASGLRLTIPGTVDNSIILSEVDLR